MKNKYHHRGYASCVHSHKRQHAPWRVYDTCCSPHVLPSHELPYPSVCNTCSYYQADKAPGALAKGGVLHE